MKKIFLTILTVLIFCTEVCAQNPSSTVPESDPIVGAIVGIPTSDGAGNITPSTTEEGADITDPENVYAAGAPIKHTQAYDCTGGASCNLTPDAGYDIYDIIVAVDEPCAIALQENAGFESRPPHLKIVISADNSATDWATFTTIAAQQQTIGTVKVLDGEQIQFDYTSVGYATYDTPDRWVQSNTRQNFGIKYRSFGSVLTNDGDYAGNIMPMTVDSGQSNTSFGQAYHIDTDGELIEADGDVASSGAAPAFCLALASGTGAINCLLEGQICETDWNWTIGGKIYLSDDPSTTTGLTQTPLSTTGDQSQPLGVALSADTIYFKPVLDTVEVP